MASYLGELTAVPGDRRILAALGPKMLDLAAELAHGAHTYFVPVEHTRIARERLGAGPVLAVEQAFVLESDPVRARAAAREYTSSYLRLFPNYTNNLRRLGWSDADIADGGSDALTDALVVHGGPAELAARVRAHLDAGADHVCVQPVVARDTDPTPAYAAVAKAIL
jgi:probable F420-dependent oxidoreductase